MDVLVTGANGHLGFNLVQTLLAAGHGVRAGVRSIADKKKVAPLERLPGIELVSADLSRPDQLRAAMDGIELVYHTAAVYANVLTGPASEVLDASIKGADSVLRIAASANVRKVVLTSSTVTLPMRRPGERASDEDDWNEDLRMPYARAKTEGEQTAWRTARDVGIDLVTVLPGGFTGPGFARNTPTIDLVEAMMLGAMRLGVPDMNWPLVDVRDVCQAHRLAGEQACAGRFVVCNDTQPTLREMIETMRVIDSRVPRPLATIPDFMLPAMPLMDHLNRFLLGSPRIAPAEGVAMIRGKRWHLSNSRIKEVLGWRQTVSQEETLRDTMAVLRARAATR